MRLPTSHRPQLLRSFWLIVCLAAGIAACLAAYRLVGARWAALALPLFAVLVAPGLVRPGLAAGPYRLWNRLALLVAKLGRVWTLQVCFFVMTTVAGLAGSRLALAPPAASSSMWVSLASDSQRGHPDYRTAGQRGWLKDFVRWAASSSDNWWMLCLLPFMVIVSGPQHPGRNG